MDTSYSLCMLKWNVDAFANDNLGLSRFGGVMRNHEGEFLCIFYCFTGNINSNKANVLLVQKALFFSIYYNYASSNQWVEKSNSYNVIIWIKGENIIWL